MGDTEFQAAATPRTLWVELTSKCPFDCVFCSRKLRRGNGQHLPFTVYKQLIESLRAPRRLVLNYSGESLYYPQLIPAIQLGQAQGAFVELVTVFSTIHPDQMRALANCGLGRLTVSVHANDPERYAQIYRYSSFAELEGALKEFLTLCRASPCPPIVDFAFVAMDRNLDQLDGVARFADSLGIRDVMIFPVMRRDAIPERFANELDEAGGHREEFRAKLRAAASPSANVRFTISDHDSNPQHASLGEIPIPFPGPLPAGARVHRCEQNPWETAHVLSNGDVVACEVLDKTPLGNLLEQPLNEIWHGAAYQEFRRRYSQGHVPECRTCVWKWAYLPSQRKGEILARDGYSSQLLYGWHEPHKEDVIWSSQEAAAILEPRPGSHSIHVSGILPSGPKNDPNELVISSGGQELGRLRNPWAEAMPFGLDFDVPGTVTTPWVIEFRTRHVLRPRDGGLGEDCRDLGFALVFLASIRGIDSEQYQRQRARLAPIRDLVNWVDYLGRAMHLASPSRRRLKTRTWRPGVSVVIPERENVTELRECLRSVHLAARDLPEPVEVILVVNGCAPKAYAALQREFPDCTWRFFGQPLGFSEAVRHGLRAARFDWVYLVNSDVVLDRRALRTALPLRAPDVFAISSQIFLKDPTRFRQETNFTILLMEDGLPTIHDQLPQSDFPAECCYAGGGASLFQKRLLEGFVKESAAYSPFYWEDVEWGWRARKLGYRVIFCPASTVRHSQGTTIMRHFTANDVETIRARNQVLFHLRNLTGAGSTKRLFDGIARLPEDAFRHFLRPSVMTRSLRVRLWNHVKERLDKELLHVDA